MSSPRSAVAAQRKAVKPAERSLQHIQAYVDHEIGIARTMRDLATGNGWRLQMVAKINTLQNLRRLFFGDYLE